MSNKSYCRSAGHNYCHVCNSLAASLCIFLIATGGMPERALAQRAVSAVSSDVVTKVSARVSRFLHEAAGISRNSQNVAEAAATPATGSRYDQVQPSQITRHRLWSDPASGPAWTVHLSAGEAVVDARSMNILSFLDGADTFRLQHEPAPALTDCISREDALELGKRYVGATGMPIHDLFVDTIELRDNHVPPVAYTRTWTIRWLRKWHGVPFEDQAVQVILEAGHGLLEVVSGAVNMPPPSNTRIDVSVVKAVDIAGRFLSGRNVGPLGSPSVFLRVALQDDWWTAERPESVRKITPSRLGWLVRFPVQRGAMTYQYEVRVDSSTGAIIGGNVWGTSRGSVAVDPNRFAVIDGLSRSKDINIRSIAGTSQAAHTLRSASNPLAYYGALSTLTIPRQNGKTPPFVASHRLNVTQHGGGKVTYDYDAKSGVVADAAGHKAQVSHQLQDLLRIASH